MSELLDQTTSHTYIREKEVPFWAYVAVFGDDQGALLSAIHNTDQWIGIPGTEMAQRTGMTMHRVWVARDALKRLGIIDVQNTKAMGKGMHVTHWKIDRKVLCAIMDKRIDQGGK